MALKFLGKSKTSNIKYGRLYNWYVVVDERNISNEDWHVPSSAEWAELGEYLDPLGTYLSNDAGGKLKEIGFIYWDSPNTDATNSSKFNARGHGIRGDSTGEFSALNQNGGYFSTNQTDEDNTGNHWVVNNSEIFRYSTGTNNYPISKKTGNAVRLIKDSTSLSDGQSGTYIGNDGTVYKTICISDQEWLADNLVETKYRNGNSIPNVTGNTEWSELTSGAYCDYNNNESFVFNEVSKKRLKFGIEKIKDVLNFNNDAYVEFPSSPILSGLTDDISFYMYLDTNNYTDLKILSYFSDVNNTNSYNIFIAGLYQSNLVIQVNSGDVIGNKKIDITNFVDKTVFVQIKKNDSTNPSSIDYVKFNGVSQTLSNNTDISFSIFPVSLIGAVYNINSELYVYRLNQATIWDITIPGRHNWKGNPDGNQNSAWVDNIGNINGTVGGTTKITRIVPGVNKSKLSLRGKNYFDGFIFNFDASRSDTITIDGSSRVSEWKDILNNNIIIENNSDNRPLYDLANNRVHFRRSNSERLTKTSNPSISQPLTQIAVFEPLTSDINQMVIYGEGSRECGLWLQDGGNYYAQNSANHIVNKDGGGTITWSINTKYIAIYKWDGTNTRVYVNGIEGSVSSGTNGMNGIRLGYGTFGDYLDGYIYEIAVADKIISNEEQTKFINYLKSKWNISF